MKTFDLKKFRGERGLSQEDFALKINRSQATVSHIENGTKVVNDKFLDAVAAGFKVSLEEYKSYNQQEVSIPAETPIENNHLTPPTHDTPDITLKYQQLLEDKARLDEKYFDLLEKYASLESSLLKENNDLLKKIDKSIEEIMKHNVH